MARAFEMPQNSVDNGWLRNKGYAPHAAAAPAQQRVRLEDLLNQAGPRAAGFAGCIRIALFGKFRRRHANGLVLPRCRGNPPAVGAGPIKSLTMASPIRDVGCDAVDPLERIQLDRGCAGSWIGRGFQNQSAS